MNVRRVGNPTARSGIPRAILVALFGLAALMPAKGRGADGHGHDHGPRTQIVVSPRVEARIGDRQLLLVYAQGHLVAFLERFADGVPVRGAEMDATVNFQGEPLREVAPGIYRSGEIALPGGRNEIEVAWRLDGEEGTATLNLLIPSRAAAAGGLDNLPVPSVPGWMFLAAALLLYIGVTLLFWRRAVQRRRTPEDAPAFADPHGPRAAE